MENILFFMRTRAKKKHFNYLLSFANFCLFVEHLKKLNEFFLKSQQHKLFCLQHKRTRKATLSLSQDLPVHDNSLGVEVSTQQSVHGQSCGLQLTAYRDSPTRFSIPCFFTNRTHLTMSDQPVKIFSILVKISLSYSNLNSKQLS